MSGNSQSHAPGGSRDHDSQEDIQNNPPLSFEALSVDSNEPIDDHFQEMQFLSNNSRDIDIGMSSDEDDAIVNAVLYNQLLADSDQEANESDEEVMVTDDNDSQRSPVLKPENSLIRDSKLTVENSNGKIMSESIAASQEEKPVTTKATSPPERLKLCNLCKEPGDLACGSCFHVVYCCPEHQADDWKVHQKACCFYSLHRAPSVVYQGPFRFQETSTVSCYENHSFEMKALCDIPENTTILTEKPFFIAPWPRFKLRKIETTMTPGIRPLCLTCFGCCKALQFNYITCSICNIPICSNDCPYVSKHKENECSYMKNLQNAMGKPDQFDSRTQGTTLMDDGATELFYLDIMIVRFILLCNKLQQECGDNEKWNEKWAKLAMTWKINQIKRTFFSRRGELISREPQASLPLSYFVTQGNTEVLWYIFCILEGNMLIMDLPFRRMKVLCSAAINARHGCAPNSHAFLKYDTNCDLENLLMTITSGISIDAGESITISYCPLILPTPQRKSLLKNQYLFWCDCLRCQDPTECRTLTNSLKCPICHTGYIVPPLSLTNKADNFPPPNLKSPAYEWMCTGYARCPSSNAATAAAYKGSLSSSDVVPKLEKCELDSVSCVGSYQKVNRFIGARSNELHNNCHIFLKLYDDILRGETFPFVSENGEHLAEFPVEWLRAVSKAKDAYTVFMKKVCPAFDFQGFPEACHMAIEKEFYNYKSSELGTSTIRLVDNINGILSNTSVSMRHRQDALREFRMIMENRSTRLNLIRSAAASSSFTST